MCGTPAGRGALAYSSERRALHWAGEGWPRLGWVLPESWGELSRVGTTLELKGHLAECRGSTGLKAERVSCPVAVTGLVPRDPGEARTTCLGWWCHCGDPGSRGSCPPSSLPRVPP